MLDRDLRRTVLQCASGHCEDCGERLRQGWTHIHHETYERYGKENLADLLVLCVPCHAKRHPHMQKMADRGPRPRKKSKSKKMPKHEKVRCQECGKWVGPGKGFEAHMRYQHPGRPIPDLPTLDEIMREDKDVGLPLDDEGVEEVAV